MLAICPRCVVRQIDASGCQLCGKPFVFTRWRFSWRWPFFKREKMRLCVGANCLKQIPADSEASLCPACAEVVEEKAKAAWLEKQLDSDFNAKSGPILRNFRKDAEGGGK